MRSRPVAFLVTLAALGGGVAHAQAAEIRVNRSCFADPADRRDTVQLTGRGFTPNAAYQVLLDGRALAGAAGRADAAGNVSSRFIAPSVGVASRTARQHAFRVGVVEGTNRPTTSFTVSRLLAAFRPARGNPRTLRVRFSMWGFSLLGQTRPPLYVHYVAPSGRVARTVKFKNATGTCGFRRTVRRKLFGFTPRRGTWRLQFDTRKRYARGTSRSSFLFYTVRVAVR